MNLSTNIYASCVQIDGNGVLIIGKSGSGKSDLILRLIENKNAILVADDRTDIKVENTHLIASAPTNLVGMLEVRGIGIIKLPCVATTKIKLVIELSQEIERLPEQEFFVFENCKIPKIKLNPFECSAIDKVVIKLKAGLD